MRYLAVMLVLLSSEMLAVAGVIQGHFYAIEETAGGSDRLIRIAFDGAVEEIGTVGGPIQQTNGLTFDYSGNLWAVGSSSCDFPDERLFKFENPSVSATATSNLLILGGVLNIHCVSGMCPFEDNQFGENRIMFIDPESGGNGISFNPNDFGEFTNYGGVFSGDATGIAHFRGSSNQVYSIEGPGNTLFRIDDVTQFSTRVSVGVLLDQTGGPFNGQVHQSVQALTAVPDGFLYGFNHGRKSIIKIDPSTGNILTETFPTSSVNTILGFAYFNPCEGAEWVDCQQNNIPDSCDLLSGVSTDCNTNGVPDECEPDCNLNDIADSCDIASEVSSDCNTDGVPDECEPDCNSNGVADNCDITVGTSMDCNTDGVPDECSPDCNSNGIADDCELSAGTSIDCNFDGIPDECQTDCNGNGAADECDVAIIHDCCDAGLMGGCSDADLAQCVCAVFPSCCNSIWNNTCVEALQFLGCSSCDPPSDDCNNNGIPDECEVDCNTNGIPDECDIASGVSSDCNTNGIVDACEEDFDLDGTIDDCDSDIDDDGVPNSADVCDFTPTPPTRPPSAQVLLDGSLRGDLDGDCDVDLFDFQILVNDFTGPNSSL